MQACWKEKRGLGGAEAVDRKPVLADALGERQEVAVRRHDPEAVDIAAVEQVHRLDGHAHVGRALALDDVELLHRDDRVEAGQLAPALEAGLGPIAVGAADVDRAELAEHQQHFVEMLGASIVGVDQQGDVVLSFAVSFVHCEFLWLLATSLSQWRGMATSGRAI